VNREQPILSLETEIVNVLKRIYDPEIPVNIYDLGLIYDIETDEYNRVRITMTLTAPNCPVADILPNEIKEKIQSIEGVKDVEINLVFDPPWDQSMMSEEALLELGML
jgi:FeS assembly SUF system protein